MLHFIPKIVCQICLQAGSLLRVCSFCREESTSGRVGRGRVSSGKMAWLGGPTCPPPHLPARLAQPGLRTIAACSGEEIHPDSAALSLPHPPLACMAIMVGPSSFFFLRPMQSVQKLPSKDQRVYIAPSVLSTYNERTLAIYSK